MYKIDFRQTDQRTLYILAVLMLLPIIMTRDFTPDNELRYLSIADEALRNHSFLTFTHHGVMYADKPPLYLLLVMACKTLAGGYHAWMLGMLSVIPMIVIMRTMDSWMASEGYCLCRRMAMPMLATTALVTGAAMVERMDMLFTMFVVLAMRSFYNMYKGGSGAKTSRWLFPMYMFLAVFTKGALGLLIPLASVTVFLAVTRQLSRWTEFFSLRIWAVMLALTAAWFIGVCAEAGGAYLEEMLVRQTMGRAFNSFHHQRPLWHYAVAVTYCSLPWTPVIIYVAVNSLRRKSVCSDLQKLLIVTPLTTLALLSCISSKLDIYMLPAYPFLIYFTAMFIPEVSRNKWACAGMGVVGALLCAVLPTYAVMTGMDAFALYDTAALWATATVLTLAGVCTLAAALRKRLELTISAMTAGLACAVLTAGFATNTINPYIGYGTACRQALRQADGRPGDVLVDSRISHAEDMDVYLGNRMKIVRLDSLRKEEIANAAAIIVREDKPKHAVCLPENRHKTGELFQR